MKLITYEYHDILPNKWEIKKFNLKDMNLIAGLSGVGKTRLLNTIHNLSLMMQKKRELTSGKWNITFKLSNNFTYRYYLEIKRDKNKNAYISKEQLSRDNRKIIDRTKNVFNYNSQKLPKFAGVDIGIYLLRSEEKIKKIFEGFCNIYIRRNNPDYSGRSEIESGFGILSKELLIKKSYSLKEIHEKYRQINVQLFLLEKHYPKIFNRLTEDFKEIFPFVSNIYTEILTRGDHYEAPGLPRDSSLPMLIMKEIGIDNEIPLLNFSSGMLRALIQLIDIHTMPSGSIYLIDELENSLGIKSLPVMIDVLFGHKKNIQYIFTTHHPYIFNNVDVKYWYILTRKGNIVYVNSSEVLQKRFSKSHQENYIQLINSELIEQGI